MFNTVLLSDSLSFTNHTMQMLLSKEKPTVTGEGTAAWNTACPGSASSQ